MEKQEELASYEQELADYLQERIKPGLNRGAIPLLARSIAKEIAHRENPNGASEDAEAEDEVSAEAEDEESAEVEDEVSAEAEDEESAEAEDEESAEIEDEDSAEAEDEESAEAEDEDSAEAEDEDSAEAEDEDSAEAENEDSAESEAQPDFEADMHELQAELGEDWILRFSVQGDDAWLTAEKDDGSQRVEAPTASVLSDVVEVINERGGRTT